MSYGLVSNANILYLFKDIEELQQNPLLSDSQKNRKTKQILDKIVKKVSFLVDYQAQKYKPFHNYNDLRQEGYLGLVHAVYTFDRTKNTNFFGYATQWIKHKMKKAASKHDIVYNPEKVRVVYSEQDPNEPDPAPTPEEVLYRKEVSGVIQEALAKFSERDRNIMERSFGLRNYKPETLMEVGAQVNLSHERVRQIKNRIIQTLRQDRRLVEINED